MAMNRQQQIKAAAEAAMASHEADPAAALTESVTKVRVADGLACEIAEGRWRLTSDLPASAGGSDSGPNPGTLIRGAVGACLAMDCMTWAAIEGVPIHGIEVDVKTVLDGRGMLDMADVAPGFQSLTVVVNVTSSAPENDIARIVRHAVMCNPRIHDLGQPIPIETQLTVTASADRAA